eukprot:TRINITY_DN12488_c0_g1_i1.p2 TRINITY_DN12488_c0_g1~~TRINITY_DN12488_c0_g1_i1.p2  ORF type:complete len:237 (+),score=69.32 TRINITY_DN12488_c0_g1_i1:88-798(+)
MVLVLGLTGGIACGKSTVSNMLQQKPGTCIVDADAVARAVLAPGTSHAARVLREFRADGIADADGNIDRDRLGEVVFADRRKRARLSAIMQWPILRGLLHKIFVAVWTADLVVLDMPLLFETKWFLYICEAVMVVSVPEEVQISRLIARNGYTREHSLDRIRAQMPSSRKAALADFVIDNSGDRRDTARQVDAALAALRQRRRVLTPLRRCVALFAAAATALVYGALAARSYLRAP